MREGAEGFLGSAPGGPHSALIVRGLTGPSSFAALYPKDVSLLGNFLASVCRQCRRRGFDPWTEQSSGGGNGNPLQYSHGQRRLAGHGAAKSHD